MANTSIIRKIGSIEMDVTVEERHDDSLTITDFPIEKGAVISDHAYKNPMQVTIVAGKGGSKGESVPKETYDALLKLQEEREPFAISTGKRQYENMLVQGVSVTTDPDTENVLLVTVDCREVIIVSTQTTTVPAVYQAQAAKTQETQKAGTKQTGEQEGSAKKRSVLANLLNA